MPAVYVSLGSNVDRERHVRDGLAALHARFGSLLESSVYEAPAEGFDGEDFYNLVIAFDTDESIEAVATALREIEKDHGRLRETPKLSSRTLDLDLLLYGDRIQTQRPPIVPREDITRYAFVLGPLAEIAPQLSHPILGHSIGELWRTFGPKRQSIRRVDQEAEPR